MNIPANIYRGYDIRGIYPTEINEEYVKQIGKAFATLMKKENQEKIIIGRDVRLSSQSLYNALVEGIIETGMNIINIGECITPMTYFAREILEVKPSIMITASHNPKEYNGLKICGTGKDTIYGEEIQNLRKFVEKSEFATSEKKGTIEEKDIKETYINYITDRVKMGGKKLKVAVDCGNGAAGIIVKEFFKKLDVGEVIYQCIEPDGNFPIHHPDPSQEKNMLEFEKFIVENKCDIGIAFDGDADRIICFDENGKIILGDEYMLIIWRNLIKKYPGEEAILDVKCTQSLYEELQKIGAKPRFVKVGSSLIKKEIRENNLKFAGEYAGHIYFNDEYFGFDDSFYAAARILQILTNTDKTMSMQLEGINKYIGTPEHIVKVTDETKWKIVSDVVEYFKNEKYKVIDVDGARVIFENGWGLVRASNTGPNLTVKAEAKTKEQLEEIMQKLENVIEKCAKQDLM